MKLINEENMNFLLSLWKVTWLPFPRPPQLPRDISDPRGWKAKLLVRGDNLCEHNWVGLMGNKTCFAAFPSCFPILHAFS